MKKRILVAIEIFDESNSGLVNFLEESGFEVVVNKTGKMLSYKDSASAELYQDVDYIIAGLETYDLNFFKDHPRVIAISRVGVGVDSIDLESAENYQTEVYVTSDRPSVAVAELCVSNMIALLRKTFKMSNFLHQEQWIPIQGSELRNCKVGILGFGSIGKQVAKRVFGFDCQIYASGRSWDKDFASKYGVQRVEAEELFKTCDIVTIHLPFTPETRHSVSREKLESMKEGSIVLNTSRSGVLDNIALKELLMSGHIRGAAIDVFDEHRSIEPYADCENVILTPHIGSHTRETRMEMEKCAVENILFHHRLSYENDHSEVTKILKHLKKHSPSRR